MKLIIFYDERIQFIQFAYESVFGSVYLDEYRIIWIVFIFGPMLTTHECYTLF